MKRIRHERLRVGEYRERLAAKKVIATSTNCLVVIWHSKGLEYEYFNDDDKARLRSVLA
jgi:hypothetical protein